MVPSAQEISALSDAFVINQRDLLPLIPDTDRGIKPQTWDDTLKSIRTITRNGTSHYEYADLVLAREVPQMRPEYLKILITEGENVVINNGHILHQLTFLLHGQLEFYWRWPPSSSGQVHKRIFNERDSWFIRAYVPHAFRSTNANDLAEIIAFTFSSGGQLRCPLAFQALNIHPIWTQGIGQPLVRIPHTPSCSRHVGGSIPG